MLEIVKYYFIFTIVLFTAIPASMFIAIKIITLIIGILLILFLLITNRLHIKKKTLLMFLFLITVLLVWTSITFTYTSNYEITLRALASYTTLFILFSIFTLLHSLNLLSMQLILKTFIFSLAVYVCIKMIIMFLPFLNILSLEEVSELLNSGVYVNYRSEDQGFLRIATANDLMISFSLFFVLFSDSFGLVIKRKTSVTLLLIFTVGLFLTFTRYIWISGILIYLLYLIQSKYFIFIISFLIVGFFVFQSVTLEDDAGIFQEATVRTGDHVSLDAKTEQMYILYEQFSEYPLLGSGLGSYVKNYTRSDYLPFIYETQWVSILMQFGLIGTSILLFYILYPVKNIHIYLKNRAKLYLTAVFILFLASGFTNPNITPLNMAIIYFYVLISINYRSENDRKNININGNL